MPLVTRSAWNAGTLNWLGQNNTRRLTSNTKGSWEHLKTPSDTLQHLLGFVDAPRHQHFQVAFLRRLWNFPLKISRLEQFSCCSLTPFSLVSSPNSVHQLNHPSANLQKMPTWCSASTGSFREWKDASSSWGLSPGCSPSHCFQSPPPHLDEFPPLSSLVHHKTVPVAAPKLICGFARHGEELGHDVSWQPVLEGGSTGEWDASRWHRQIPLPLGGSRPQGLKISL